MNAFNTRRRRAGRLLLGPARLLAGRLTASGAGGPEAGENGRLVGNLDELVTEFRAIGGSLPDVRIFEES